MKKTVVAAFVAFACSAQAASLDDIKISGFGSVGVGKSTNDVGYAGYTDEKFDTKQDTIAGIQFDFAINDKAKFTTQVVANGRYDFEPEFETAYLSYKFDSVTARAGILRTPFFMYSDYVDVGYAYPMIRPSQEVYEHIIINNYTGGDLLIPFDIGDTTLLLQPFAGISQVDEADSPYGEVDLNKTFGLTAHWYVDDFTFRASYATATTSYSAPSSVELLGLTGYAEEMLDDQDALFASIGAQYDNGQLLAVVEAVRIEVDGRYSDSDAFSGLVGYRFGEIMPYASIGWKQSTDDEERETAVPGYDSILAYEQAVNNFETISYSVGTRWDFAQNMALKLDVTYADFKGTSGRLAENVDDTTAAIKEDDTLVYSASVDFVF
ncbi:hypothetical protein [Vibrio hippocampi]|uniref:Porin n=1 Tax=Vibrio hippocampi TaxID=654686 RepID=A0ABM8ZMU7_9VIBR|nr:hypothetical protein [Vibrio hippocampi]CAH0529546.1 hypothetical protein VHP8226_03300 [Vibrio hippocampi]